MSACNSRACKELDWKGLGSADTLLFDAAFSVYPSALLFYARG